MTSDSEIEQEIQAKGLTAPRVTPDRIETEIASTHYFTAAQGAGFAEACDLADPISAVPEALQEITICVLILRNGFKVVGVNEGPVDPKNFDADIGRKMARQKAIDQIWPLLGYELKSWLHAKALSVPQPVAPFDGDSVC